MDYFKEINPYIEKFKPTKCWKIHGIESIKNLYIKNVINYKKLALQSSTYYKIGELNIIKSGMASKIKISFKSETFDYTFDLKEPKIHFKLKHSIQMNNPIEDKVKLIKTMVQFATVNGFFSKTSGAHICLNLQSQDQVEGYLRLSIDKFYQVHPLPEIFLKNFQKINEYIILT